MDKFGDAVSNDAKWRQLVAEFPEKKTYYPCSKEEIDAAKALVRKERKRLSLEWGKGKGSVVNFQTTLNKLKKLSVVPAWVDELVVSDMYHLAKLKTIETGYDWHVDHVVPLRSNLVCGLHCEANLQVIPGSENISKGNRYWPDMP